MTVTHRYAGWAVRCRNLRRGLGWSYKLEGHQNRGGWGYWESGEEKRPRAMQCGGKIRASWWRGPSKMAWVLEGKRRARGVWETSEVRISRREWSKISDTAGYRWDKVRTENCPLDLECQSPFSLWREYFCWGWPYPDTGFPGDMGGQNLEMGSMSMGHSLSSLLWRRTEELARAGWVMGVKVFLLSLKKKIIIITGLMLYIFFF